MVFKFFKKNKAKPKEGKEKAKKADKLATDKLSKEETAKGAAFAVGSDYAYRLVKAPHVSEKASNISVQGQYVFKVFGGANKSEIKKAIKRFYGVEVKKVNVINVHSKKRTVGRHEGIKKGYKKAVVILKKGYTIETAPK